MTVMEKQEYYNMYDAAEYLWWYKSLREILEVYFKKHIPKTAAILDAGCGTGENMHHLQQLGYKNIQGIDLSDDSLKCCKDRGLTRVKKGDLSNLDFKNNSFDAIINMDVLGSIPEKDKPKAIQELYRVLKPGGTLFLQCAALEWLRSQHDTVVNVHHRYTKNEIANEFQFFEIIKLSYRFFILFPLMTLVKLLKRKSDTHPAVSDVNKPHPLVNTVLLAIQRIENALFPLISFPIGTSLFLIARKPKK